MFHAMLTRAHTIEVRSKLRVADLAHARAQGWESECLQIHVTDHNTVKARSLEVAVGVLLRYFLNIPVLSPATTQLLSD